MAELSIGQESRQACCAKGKLEYSSFLFELSIIVHVWKYMFQLSLMIEFVLKGALVAE